MLLTIARLLGSLIPIASARGVGDDITGILSTVVGFIKQGEDDNPQLEALTKEIEALAASGEDPTPERLNALVKDISDRSERIQDVDLSGGETEET